MGILTDSTDRDEASLSQHCDIFACFPNLSELYLVSLGLENIEFVERLPRLQYLDITGNPVADLTPLEQLQDFQTSFCLVPEEEADRISGFQCPHGKNQKEKSFCRWG